MKIPLVSVICLCHNQREFVLETLDSVFQQTYEHIEIIIVDDGSTDGSKEIIDDVLKNHRDLVYVNLSENKGNTEAFNRGLEKAHGKYIVDLACDDIMLSQRIEKQVSYFETLNEEYGVIYSDAEYFNNEESLGRHFSNKRWAAHVGNIYTELVESYFIPPPTMMMKREVFEDLGGYDETLAYEDFDFWVRSARTWYYGFQDEVLTKIRRRPNSLSTRLYERHDRQLESTLRICQKILKMNNSRAEHNALIKRLRYEMRHSFLTGNSMEAHGFYMLLNDLGGANMLYKLMEVFNRFSPDLSTLRKIVIRLRH